MSQLFNPSPASGAESSKRAVSGLALMVGISPPALPFDSRSKVESFLLCVVLEPLVPAGGSFFQALSCMSASFCFA
jgi:hypothetical protein